MTFCEKIIQRNKSKEKGMLTILLRTVLVYVLLVITMRLMGKRQLGELEVSELVTTLLVSEIASLPIVDKNIPLAYAIIPLVTVLTLEVALSMVLVKFPKLKNIASARPSVLIRRGKLDQKEMQRIRITLDELISEVRQAGVPSLADVDYAILEQNGKISILTRKEAQPPSAKELQLRPTESGIEHALIEDGRVDRYNLKLMQLDDAWLSRVLTQKGLSAEDVFFLGRDDAENLYWIEKEKK